MPTSPSMTAKKKRKNDSSRPTSKPSSSPTSRRSFGGTRRPSRAAQFFDRSQLRRISYHHHRARDYHHTLAAAANAASPPKPEPLPNPILLDRASTGVSQEDTAPPKETLPPLLPEEVLTRARGMQGDSMDGSPRRRSFYLIVSILCWGQFWERAGENFERHYRLTYWVLYTSLVLWAWIA